MNEFKDKIDKVILYERLSSAQIGILLGVFIGTVEIIFFLVLADNSRIVLPDEFSIILFVFAVCNAVVAPIMVLHPAYDYKQRAKIARESLEHLLSKQCKD